MKKTARTLLTAAIFATALGSAAPSQFRQPVQALGDPVSEVMTGMAVLYGPPPALSTTSTARTRRTHTTEPTEVTTFTMTVDTAPVVLYGPPWVFYPTGDANMDRITDARDLTRIKQIALGNWRTDDYNGRDIADVDHDGDVDADDVHLFMEEVLGIPKKEDPAVTTTAIETTAEETTLTTTGPVIRKTTAPGEVTLDSDILTGLIRITDAPIIALYGPPSIDWDLTAEYSEFVPRLTVEKEESESKTTKTETVEEANRHKDS